MDCASGGTPGASETGFGSMCSEPLIAEVALLVVVEGAGAGLVDAARAPAGTSGLRASFARARSYCCIRITNVALFPDL